MKCICIHTPKGTDFVPNREYLYDYIIDGVKVENGDKYIILDELTFCMYFKKIRTE